MLGAIAERLRRRNQSRAMPSEHASLVAALRYHAENQPTRTAFQFLPRGLDVEWECTFSELDARAQRVAGWLHANGLGGSRVVLMFPTGPDYLCAILGCLYAGVVAIPLDVPRPNRECSRLKSVAAQSQARFVLTSAATLSARDDLCETLGNCGLVGIDINEAMSHSSNYVAEVNRDSVAYLQYTSGSTREPKGVMVTHANVAHNLSVLAEIAGDDIEHSGVGWLPFFHDMGLVGTVFLPIWMGFTHTFMPPEAFVMSPGKWLQAITTHRATLSPAPSFAYELCTRRVKPEHREQLDLSSWRIAFNGSERIDPSVQRRFTEGFSQHGFREETLFPCYGLAESTLIVTGGRRDARPVVATFNSNALTRGEALIDDEGPEFVGCGYVRSGADLVIVDPETQFRRAPGHVGEIWVRSESVAAGYFANEDATHAAFSAYESMTGDGPYLRTGDLGFLWNDELFVTGRLRDLIILGGQNISPEDLEFTIESAHPAIRSGGAVAFSVDSGGTRPQVVAVAEVRRLDQQHLDVVDAVRSSVARQNDTTIDEIVLVHGRQIPRTPNGKKQRSVCRQAYLSGELGGASNED